MSCYYSTVSNIIAKFQFPMKKGRSIQYITLITTNNEICCTDASVVWNGGRLIYGPASTLKVSAALHTACTLCTFEEFDM